MTLQKTVDIANTARTSSSTEIIMSHELAATAASVQELSVSSSSVAELRRLGEQLCVV